MTDEQRSLPANELDMQLMMTNSCWGRSEVPTELKAHLTTNFAVKDEHGQPMFDQSGNPLVTEESLWGILGHYTRDMRLANLSEWNNELQTCRYMIDLATDYLVEGMIPPFISALSRAVTILETSQSKGGFLRKQQNTLTQKNINENREAPKKGFFGGAKKDNGGGY